MGPILKLFLMMVAILVGWRGHQISSLKDHSIKVLSQMTKQFQRRFLKHFFPYGPTIKLS